MSDENREELKGGEELKKPIIAQLDVIDARNAVLEKATERLSDRLASVLASVLASPLPVNPADEKAATANCAIEERLCQIREGLDNRIGAIQSFIDRLQL